MEIEFPVTYPNITTLLKNLLKSYTSLKKQLKCIGSYGRA